MAWVETLSRHKTLNHHATYISQSGIVNKTPLWDKGLRGEGHTVAVADTGVDHDNCYFHDVNVSTPINTFNPLHRKIVAYLTNTKISPPDRFGGDQVDGHGTHTAGTVAGEPPQGAPAVSSTWCSLILPLCLCPLSVFAPSLSLLPLIIYHS